MTAIAIILAIIILLLLLPVGVDAAFVGGAFSLSVKAGPLKLRLLPAKPKKKNKNPKPKKPRKPKKPKGEKDGEAKSRAKLKLTLADIKEMASLALRALSRLRRFLSIDVLMVHLSVAGDDPYDTVRQYGAVNAALCALLPHLHRAFKIKKQDIQTTIDFAQDKISADVRFAATYRIWELMCIAFCALGSAIAWLVRHRKRTKAAAVSAQAKAKRKKTDAKEEKTNKRAPSAAEEKKGS